MKIKEIVEFLNSFSYDHDFSDTCDTFKIGTDSIDVKKVAVTMFGTPNVIKAAKEWGADFLIVHEPLYYNHFDNHIENAVVNEKKKLLADSGLTVYRYHDHPHFSKPDLIAAGELSTIGLKGDVEYTDTFDLVRITLDQPMTSRQLATTVKEKLNLKSVRIAGALDQPIKRVSCMFGAPGGLLNELMSDNCEVLIAGEVCEWELCEYARDASELGYAKSVLALGHIGSERDGMVYITRLLADRFTNLDVKYFESREVYSYV